MPVRACRFDSCLGQWTRFSLAKGRSFNGERSRMFVAEFDGVILVPFCERHAADICRWANTDQEVRWLAPSTSPPLTPEKVLAWLRPGGYAYVYRPITPAVANVNHPDESSTEPLAYGELNPMPNETLHWWLGHCVVRPGLRGRGIGLQFVRELLGKAFGLHAARRVSLIVFPDNEPAIRCYRRAGFVQIGQEFHSFREPREKLLRLEIHSAKWAT